MEVKTYNGEAVYSHVEEVLGSEILEVYKDIENNLRSHLGEIQLISEPYEDLDLKIKGLSVFSMTPIGAIFFKIEMDKNGKIQIINRE